MANPSVVACAADTWVKVASAVTAGALYNMTPTVEYMQTYRMAGQAAPSNNDGAILAFSDPYAPLAISAAAAIDVYLKAVGANGSVRVDV